MLNEDMPRRIFLDSSVLQTIQDYGEFLYENVTILPTDPIYRDSKGIAKLDGLRNIMKVNERALFEFAISRNSFKEVEAKGDLRYLQWAYDVLDHWIMCISESGEPCCDEQSLQIIESDSFNYLSVPDKALLRDAISLECDVFLTMENKLPKCSNHIEKHLGIRIFSPDVMWEFIRKWAPLFY